MNLILLGAPGSGKGTQAKRLQEILKVPHVCTGDILREACRQKNTLGAQVESYMQSGALVPDDIIVEVMEKRLKESDCNKGYILDGFPRTLGQAEALDQMLTKSNVSLDLALNLTVDSDLLIKRMVGRGRSDDEENVVNERLRVYEAQTAPLVDHYRAKGKLKEVEGTGTVEEITNRLIENIRT